MAEVRFFFDFLSPYSYLASRRLRTAPYDQIPMSYCPVTFGSILSKLGVKGPGEIPNRRRHQLMDVLLVAKDADFPLEGPPTHPFNSVYALRSVVAAPEEAQARLTHAYFDATWARGEALDDLDVLRRITKEAGVDHDPEDVATDRTHRATLKANTKDLLAMGGWGVPTFVVDDILFWGQDRLAHLASYLAHRNSPLAKCEELLGRPQPGRIV